VWAIDGLDGRSDAVQATELGSSTLWAGPPLSPEALEHIAKEDEGVVGRGRH